MHNKPHTAESKARMSAARRGKAVKWDSLPEADIVARLLNSDATTRSIAAEYGCCDSVIKKILRKHTTPEQRLSMKREKQAARLRGHNRVEAKRQRDPLHVAARTAVNNAVKRGRLVRPSTCQAEGCDHGGRIEAHHWKGYEPERWLDVIWLCPSCHRKADSGSPDVWVLTFELVKDGAP